MSGRCLPSHVRSGEHGSEEGRAAGARREGEAYCSSSLMVGRAAPGRIDPDGCCSVPPVVAVAVVLAVGSMDPARAVDADTPVAMAALLLVWSERVVLTMPLSRRAVFCPLLVLDMFESLLAVPSGCEEAEAVLRAVVGRLLLSRRADMSPVPRRAVPGAPSGCCTPSSPVFLAVSMLSDVCLAVVGCCCCCWLCCATASLGTDGALLRRGGEEGGGLVGGAAAEEEEETSPPPLLICGREDCCCCAAPVLCVVALSGCCCAC